MRSQSFGQQGRPCLSALAAAFRHARSTLSDDYCKARALAAAASRVPKGKQGGSFGLKTQKVLKKVALQKRVGLWQRTKGAGGAQRALELANSTDSHDIVELRQLARRHVWLDKEQDKLETAKIERSLGAFHDKIGPETVARIQAILPHMPMDPSELRCLPSHAGDTLKWCNMGADRSAAALAWASECGGCNVPAALESEWKQRHETVTVAAAAPLADNPPKTKLCRQAGYCVCRGAGRLRHQMRNAILKEMKTLFPDKPSRLQLRSGLIVVCWSRSVACSDDCDSKPMEYWYHIGSMSFSPYKPTLMGVDRITHVDERINGDTLERAVVEARHNPLSTWQMNISVAGSRGSLCYECCFTIYFRKGLLQTMKCLVIELLLVEDVTSE